MKRFLKKCLGVLATIILMIPLLIVVTVMLMVGTIVERFAIRRAKNRFQENLSHFDRPIECDAVDLNHPFDQLFADVNVYVDNMRAGFIGYGIDGVVEMKYSACLFRNQNGEQELAITSSFLEKENQDMTNAVLWHEYGHVDLKHNETESKGFADTVQREMAADMYAFRNGHGAGMLRFLNKNIKMQFQKGFWQAIWISFRRANRLKKVMKQEELRQKLNNAAGIAA